MTSQDQWAGYSKRQAASIQALRAKNKQLKKGTQFLVYMYVDSNYIFTFRMCCLKEEAYRKKILKLI